MDPITAGVVTAGIAALPKVINATTKFAREIDKFFGGEARRAIELAKLDADKVIIMAEANAKAALIKAKGEESLATYIYAKESVKLKNTQSIVEKAQGLTALSEKVTDEPVNQDWMTRFFSIAEDISDDEMQKLWAQILAGEVKQPKSYSLRTLEVLKNMTQEDAQLLVRASAFIISNNKNLCTEKYCLPLLDVVRLGDMGIVNSNDLNWNMTFAVHSTNVVEINKRIILMGYNTQDKEIKVSLSVKVLTIAGQELLKLVSPQEVDNNFVNNIASSLKAKNKCTKVTKHIIIEYLSDGRYRYQANGIEI